MREKYQAFLDKEISFLELQDWLEPRLLGMIGHVSLLDTLDAKLASAVEIHGYLLDDGITNEDEIRDNLANYLKGLEEGLDG